MTLQQLCNVTYRFFTEGREPEWIDDFDKEINTDPQEIVRRMVEGEHRPPPAQRSDNVEGLMAAFHIPPKE